jgi:DNA replication protein DnaC
MNLIELDRALKQLRLGGMAAVLETRLRQAQAEPLAPIDLLSCLVSDELALRGQRLLERRTKQAQFRDSQKTLDNFDFAFNKKMNRSLVFDLSTGTFISRYEDALFLGPPGTGKSHLAQAIGQAAIQQGYRVLYRETHALLDDLAEATLDGTRKEHMEFLVTVPLLIVDDLGMRKLPLTAAEELLEIIMRRYERASTMLTRTGRWKTGANCWETRPPSAPCSTVYCTTDTCSSAALGAGAPKPTCHHRRRQVRTFSVLDGQSRWPVLK